MPHPKTLYFGGSFNPIHLGHLTVAEAVARAGQFDRVHLVVSADPPHKPRQTGSQHNLAAATDRLAMCELTCQSRLLFAADSLELHRVGPSYTLDSVRELRRRDEIMQGEPLYWLIGADSVAQLPTWHQAERLLAEVEFVIAARPGFSFDWEALPPAFRKLAANVVAAPLVNISATEIRRRVRAGESLSGLVDEKVADYIRDHRLYV